MTNSFEYFLKNFNHIKKQNISFVVATYVEVRGSAPQDVGARAIISNAGVISGTVGGGKIEARIISYSQELLNIDSNKTHDFKTWNLQKDIGMTCGGEVKIYFEVFRTDQSWNICVFGAGHVSQSLCRALIPLDCNITCIDHRADWVNKLPESDNLKRLCIEKPEEYIQNLPSNTYIIVMTMGHKTDVPILKEALLKECFPFVGAIGSQSKRNSMERELTSLNLNEDHLIKLVCPIGEDIGRNDPYEISLSIIFQLLKLRT